MSCFRSNKIEQKLAGEMKVRKTICSFPPTIKRIEYELESSENSVFVIFSIRGIW